MNIGVLDVPLTFKWLTIYYGNTFIPDRDLRVIHFCFQSPTVARVKSRHFASLARGSLFALLGMGGAIVSVRSQSVAEKSLQFRLPGEIPLETRP